MGASCLLLSVFLLAVQINSNLGARVQPADEERAINATRSMIQRLENEEPARIANVSYGSIRLT